MLSLARAWARWALKVLFPTPPFPDNTRILCLTVDNFSPISAIAEINKINRGWRQMTDLLLQSFKFPSQSEQINNFRLKVTPSVQSIVCVSVVSLCYQGQGPWWLQKHTASGWDSLDMMMTFQLDHWWYLDSLIGVNRIICQYRCFFFPIRNCNNLGKIIATVFLNK